MDNETSTMYRRQLNGPGKEIRLLQLLPFVEDTNETGECISCQLIDCDLNDGIQYAALSYAWGDPHDTVPINIDGAHFKITQNLHAALDQLRALGYQMLWVDAICINQNSASEREAQVKMMDSIYRCASQVIVWMGTEEHDSSSALSDLRQLGNLARSKNLTIVRDVTLARYSTSLDSFCVETIKSLSDNNFREWTRLLHFFQRPWWSRLWVIQETALSKKATVLCGAERIEWIDIMATFSLVFLIYLRWSDLDIQPYYVRQPVYYYVQSIYRAATAQYNVWSLCNPRVVRNVIPLWILFNLLSPRAGSEMQATDPRDRVYAILGLTDDEGSRGIMVRYDHDWTYRDVCIQAAQALFRLSEKRIEALGYAEKMGHPDDSELPSWVPDWRGVKIHDLLTHSFSNRLPVPEGIFEVLHGGVLIVDGQQLDDIRVLGSVFHRSGTSLKSLEELVEYESLFRLWFKEFEHLFWSNTDPEEMFLTWADDLWKVPALDFDGKGPTPSQQTAYKVFRGDIEPFPEHDGDKAAWRISQALPYFDALRIRGRRAFFSSAGYLGICNQFSQPGDHLCMFDGNPMVFVVRRGEGGRDRLIGTAYIYGVMNMEVGPKLPLRRYTLY